jgi:hypothetical protein
MSFEHEFFTSTSCILLIAVYTFGKLSHVFYKLPHKFLGDLFVNVFANSHLVIVFEQFRVFLAINSKLQTLPHSRSAIY